MERAKQGTGGFLRRLLSCETVSYEEMMALFLPLLAENIFTVGMSLLNSAMVSGSGMATLSAVTLVDTYVSMVIHIFQGLSTGAAIIVAQYHGAQKSDRMRDSAISSISAVVIFSMLLSLVSILLRTAIIGALFGKAEASVIEIAGFYMLGNCLTLPLHAFCTAEMSVLRGVGEGKTALLITITNSVIYVIGNLIFIVGMKLSVRGLIYSIALTRFITFLMCFIAKKKMHSILVYRIHELLHPNFSYLQRIIKLGSPICFEYLLFDGGRLILQMIVTPLGTNMIASYNIAYNLMTLSQIVNNSMCSTIFVAAGMCMGAGRPDDLKAMYRRIFKMNTAVYAVIGAGMIALHHPIISFFNPEEGMEIHILWCLIIILSIQVISHTSGFMTVNVLRAAGDVGFTTLISIVSMWVFRVGGGYLVSHFLGLGVEGIYVGMAMDWSFRAIVFAIRYHKGRWEKMHVI